MKNVSRLRIVVMLVAVVVILALAAGIIKKTSSDGDSEDKGPTEQEISLIPTETEEEYVPYTAEATGSTVNIGDEIASKYVVVIDEDNNQIVAQKSAHEKMIPASMTKVMTVLTAAEKIEPEALDEIVTVSQEAGDYAYSNQCSIAGFATDEQVTVRDLFYGTILPSGGDAAYQLALYCSGSMEAFVDDMNKMAEKLGISETTHFANPVGIYDEQNYSTAYDIAIIMQAAMENDICKEILPTRVYTTTKTEQNPEGLVISNWFLRRIEDHYEGGEIIGGKTGYVRESGNCAVSVCKTNTGHTYIVCTAGASSGWECIFNHVDLYNTYAK